MTTTYSAEQTLALLALREEEIPRYRDAWGDEDYLFIETRTGGNNRGDYNNSVLTGHPLYESDEDSEFDSTYAIFTFRTPAPDVEGIVAHHTTVAGSSAADELVVIDLLNETGVHIVGGDNLSDSVAIGWDRIEPLIEALRMRQLARKRRTLMAQVRNAE